MSTSAWTLRSLIPHAPVSSDPGQGGVRPHIPLTAAELRHVMAPLSMFAVREGDDA